MYNLSEMNCGPAPEYGKLTVTAPMDTSATPKTPEIINSLMAITNPLEEYVRRNIVPEEKLLSPSEYTSPDTCSSSSSNVDSPTSSPSIQSMCSQLIKESLKLTLQKKRQNNLSTSENDSNASTPLNPVCPLTGKFALRNDESSFDTEEDEGSMYGDFNGSNCGLTPEDEEKRRRRRERNKIAATKCRLKKREKTVNLVHESEVLENQNHDLKNQIQNLEKERRQLMDVLSGHKTTCMKPSPEQSPVFDYQQPPSFPIPISCSTTTPFVRNDNKMSCSESALFPDLHHLDTTFDFQDAFLKNPSIMLNNGDNPFNDRTLKSIYNTSFKPRHTPFLNNSNYKNNVSPNFNFLDNPNEPQYDSIHFNAVDSTGSGCIV